MISLLKMDWLYLSLSDLQMLGVFKGKMDIVKYESRTHGKPDLLWETNRKYMGRYSLCKKRTIIYTIPLTVFFT